jgi:hypothetical protein
MKWTKYIAVLTLTLALASMSFGAAKTIFATQNYSGTGTVSASGISFVSTLTAWLNQVDDNDNEGTVTQVTGPMADGGTLANTGSPSGTLNATFSPVGSVLYFYGNGIVYPNGSAPALGAPAGELFNGTFTASLTWTVYTTPSQNYAVLAGEFVGKLKGKGAVTGTSKQLYYPDGSGGWYLVGGSVQFTK